MKKRNNLSRDFLHKYLKEFNKRLKNLLPDHLRDIRHYLPNRTPRKWLRWMGRKGIVHKASAPKRKQATKLPKKRQKQILRKVLTNEVELTSSYLKSLEKVGKQWWI